VALLRRHQPELPRPYRIWLYPLPLGVALVGWVFVFATTAPPVLLFGLGVLAAGIAAFALWSWRRGAWPFASPQGAERILS